MPYIMPYLMDRGEDCATPEAVDRDMPPSARLEYLFATRLVALPTVTRTIALLADQTLDDLQHAVRDAHGWDDDHLYAFWLKGRYWANDRSEYTHPIHAEMPDPLAAYTGAEPKKSAAIPLARLRLKPGQRMAYVFDFGDEWRVDIRLKRIAAAGEGPRPRVVEASGDGPPQYPHWDDVDAA